MCRSYKLHHHSSSRSVKIVLLVRTKSGLSQEGRIVDKEAERRGMGRRERARSPLWQSRNTRLLPGQRSQTASFVP